MTSRSGGISSTMVGPNSCDDAVGWFGAAGCKPRLRLRLASWTMLSKEDSLDLPWCRFRGTSAVEAAVDVEVRERGGLLL